MAGVPQRRQRGTGRGLPRRARALRRYPAPYRDRDVAPSRIRPRAPWRICYEVDGWARAAGAGADRTGACGEPLTWSPGTPTTPVARARPAARRDRHRPWPADPSAATLAEAYAFCGRLARSHYENFTVASWLMPRAMRKHMHAIYAYARMADDFADEEHDLAKLDEWERELDLGLRRRAAPSGVRRAGRHRATFRHSARAVRRLVARVSLRPRLSRLRYASTTCSATRATRPTRSAGWCSTCSATATPSVSVLSDQVCSGLQLANFWQDVAVDLAKGRIYLPRRDMARVRRARRRPAPARHASSNFVALMRMRSRARANCWYGGAALAATVDRRLSRDIMMFAGGGLGDPARDRAGGLRRVSPPPHARQIRLPGAGMAARCEDGLKA